MHSEYVTIGGGKVKNGISLKGGKAQRTDPSQREFG